jgi:hypothetical protein
VEVCLLVINKSRFDGKEDFHAGALVVRTQHGKLGNREGESGVLVVRMSDQSK